MVEHLETDEFRGARFVRSDLSDVTIRDCDLSRLKVVDSFLVDVSLSGIITNVLVNDVEVTAFVQAELDRRDPDRVRIREMRTAEEFRATWRVLERRWAAAVDRARALPEALRQERVDDEWSFVETMRHLIFATDAWAVRTVLDEPMPYHRLGLTHTAYPPEDALAIGVDLDARPTFDEVMEVRAGRTALVRGILELLSDDELDRLCTRPPAPGYPDEPAPVAKCLRVVMDEELEHLHYATRDLAVLESRA